MAEYISKKAVENMFPIFGKFGETEGENIAYKTGFTDALKAVAALPVADARPERYGKWSNTMVCQVDPIFGDSHFGFKCSECGALLNKTTYCGNCGAKMDGGEVSV